MKIYISTPHNLHNSHAVCSSKMWNVQRYFNDVGVAAHLSPSSGSYFDTSPKAHFFGLTAICGPSFNVHFNGGVPGWSGFWDIPQWWCHLFAEQLVVENPRLGIQSHSRIRWPRCRLFWLVGLAQRDVLNIRNQTDLGRTGPSKYQCGTSELVATNGWNTKEKHANVWILKICIFFFHMLFG